VTGWILFDFATTVFSFVVVTRYLNDWILDERGAPDIVIGLMSAAVSVALVLTLPALGARADRTGRHMPILIPFSVLSITATALLGLVGPTWLALVVAGVAIFAFYVADAQYHPLLATIAAPAHQGRVSGAGVAVGLVGSLVALGLLGAIVDEGHAQQAFLPAAALYGAFALPMLLLLREEPRAEVTAPDGPGPSGLRRLLDGIGRARGRPYGRLLLARFLYVDAVATAIQFMAVYARRTGDFDSDSDIDLILGLSILSAIAAAVLAGRLAARHGTLPVIRGTLVIVIGALVVTAATGAGVVLWLVGPCIGGALGSLSAVDRILMLELVPPGRRGEEFGLYALVGKLSVGFGPLVLWGGVVLLGTTLGLSKLDASRCAVLALALSATAGLRVLRALEPGPAAR
jgi:UMF1 family MFS transporter